MAAGGSHRRGARPLASPFDTDHPPQQEDPRGQASRAMFLAVSLVLGIVLIQHAPLAQAVEGSVLAIAEPLRGVVTNAQTTAAKFMATRSTPPAESADRISASRAATQERGGTPTQRNPTLGASSTAPTRPAVTPPSGRSTTGPVAAPAATSFAPLPTPSAVRPSSVVGAGAATTFLPPSRAGASAATTVATALPSTPTPATPTAAWTPTPSSPPSAPAATPAATVPPTPTSSPSPTPNQSGVSCAATVQGFDAVAINRARDAAGAATVCFPAGRYSGDLKANVAGQTWQFDPLTVMTQHIDIDAPNVTLRGGRFERPTAEAFSHTLTIHAPHTTIEEVIFRGGGMIISVEGVDFVRVLNNDFAQHSGTAVALWGGADGADDNLIAGNRIIQASKGMSPVTSRGSEGPPPYPVWNRRNIVRNNYIDQGPSGWFGVEFVRSPETVIEQNTITGKNVLVSLPDSDRSKVRHNTLRGVGGNWAIEIAASNDVLVEDNEFFGQSPGNVAVSQNSGSSGTVVRRNHVRDYEVFVEGGSKGQYVDNCLERVSELMRFDDGTNAVARNGPCP
jgi:parallel beta helix pectate lyase-like protein